MDHEVLSLKISFHLFDVYGTVVYDVLQEEFNALKIGLNNIQSELEYMKSRAQLGYEDYKIKRNDEFFPIMKVHVDSQCHHAYLLKYVGFHWYLSTSISITWIQKDEYGNSF